MMNATHRKSLPGTSLDYFDAREAVDAIQPGAWDKLPYTSRVPETTESRDHAYARSAA